MSAPESGHPAARSPDGGLDEFGLIQRFFVDGQPEPQPDASQGRILLGIGDDCAMLEVAPNRRLVLSIDTLVAGVHFLPDMDARALGWRALAVNISDLAAMGADPWCLTLALTLPEVDVSWLERFSQGLFELAQRHRMRLIGGDTTRGPLSLTIQVHGTVPVENALLRSGAKPGDLVLVSGTLGDAAAALRFLAQPDSACTPEQSFLRRRYFFPEPRVQLGQALRGLANAAIDISDGLLADLGHICRRSGVGAWIDPERLPLSPALRAELPEAEARQCALSGGDDYELCFTVAPDRLERLRDWLDSGQVSVIGEIRPQPGLYLREASGRLVPVPAQGYRHFV